MVTVNMLHKWRFNLFLNWVSALTLSLACSIMIMNEGSSLGKLVPMYEWTAWSAARQTWHKSWLQTECKRIESRPAARLSGLRRSLSGGCQSCAKTGRWWVGTPPPAVLSGFFPSGFPDKCRRTPSRNQPRTHANPCLLLFPASLSATIYISLLLIATVVLWHLGLNFYKNHKRMQSRGEECKMKGIGGDLWKDWQVAQLIQVWLMPSFTWGHPALLSQPTLVSPDLNCWEST